MKHDDPNAPLKAEWIRKRELADIAAVLQSKEGRRFVTMEDFENAPQSNEALSMRLERWFARHFETHDARLHHRLGIPAECLIKPPDASRAA